MKESILIENIDKVHTTDLSYTRIRNNLDLDCEDIVLWCKKQIVNENSKITRKGKNWYVVINDNIITINAYSYTIITAHKSIT